MRHTQDRSEHERTLWAVTTSVETFADRKDTKTDPKASDTADLRDLNAWKTTLNKMAYSATFTGYNSGKILIINDFISRTDVLIITIV